LGESVDDWEASRRKVRISSRLFFFFFFFFSFLSWENLEHFSKLDDDYFPRWGHSAVVHNNKMWIAGGCDNVIHFKDIHKFDFGTTSLCSEI
jgi:hypothetical protein